MKKNLDINIIIKLFNFLKRVLFLDKRSKKQIIVCIVFLCTFVACTKSKELGSKDNPLKFFLIPAQDVLTLNESGKKLEAYLVKELGIAVRVEIPVNYITVVESFGSKRADVAILNTMGYVLARDKYQVEPALKFLNRGRENYYGQIIAHKDGPKTIEEIDGKTFGFVDPVSSSGYLFPLSYLTKNKITAKETVFAGSHDAVVTAVYQKKIDAGATFYAPPDDDGTPKDARWVVRTQFPDVFEKIKVLTLTDPIPNDPIVFRKDLDSEMKQKITEAMKKYITTDEGKKVLFDLYHITGFKEAKDSDYDVVRELLKNLNRTAEEFIKK